MYTENYDIDFVISWMNPNDENWRVQKAKYWAIEINDPNYDVNQVARFRDWDNLQYWFRGVEQFAPWVHKIYFVTWDSVPDWLNLNHPKLTVIRDSEILPEGCGPCFSPNPMETNLHRIPGLSDHFVFFNDDMFLLDRVEKTDFFKKGLPREMAVSYSLCNNISNDPFQHMLVSMMGAINGCFDKKVVQRKNIRKWINPKYGKQNIHTIATWYNRDFSGIMIPHLPSSMRKTTYKAVWGRLEEQLMKTSCHRFRDFTDITQYIFRYWAICSGDFEPTNVFKYGKEFFMNDDSLAMLCQIIENQSYKMICINDSKDIQDFKKCKDSVINSFNSILSNKSAFEK